MKTLKFILVLGSLFFTVNLNYSQFKTTESKVNTITFEKSAYGLIFLNITVNDLAVKAMIDFGDQHELQISSKVVEKLNLKTQKENYQVSDVYGNSWDVFSGKVNQLKIGNWLHEEVIFTSQNGEMEAVSEQIGTEFNAVIGWGYFSKYFTEINYTKSTIKLSKSLDKQYKSLLKTPFNINANQLIIEAESYGKRINLMIDTGSPVSVIDTVYFPEYSECEFNFKIKDQEITLKPYPQDLSILADLKIYGILGGDFLEKWVIVIDPNEKQFIFNAIE